MKMRVEAHMKMRVEVHTNKKLMLQLTHASANRDSKWASIDTSLL